MADVEILAIAAHRDDIELTCGGSLIKSARQGHTTAIIDLTAGETGTRGSAELRAQESDAAAKILGVSQRINLGLPDAGLVNTPETRALLATEGIGSGAALQSRKRIAPRRCSCGSPSEAHR